MLASLQLNNFQSHKSSELDFSNGVNVIVGQSNTGKTAILRAMNWIINGKPRGSGFIHEGEKVCISRLYISNTKGLISVERMRKGDVTEYRLDNLQSEKPIVFTAFGNDIPEEITQIFNFNDINIQEQLSPYFLVLDTPGRVAQYLNEITRLDEIDKVIFSLSKKIRDSSAILFQTEDKLIEAKKKLAISQLFNLESFNKKIVLLSELFEESKKLTAISVTLALLVAQLDENYEKYVKLPSVTVEQAMVLEKEAIVCNAEKKNISRLISSIEELDIVSKYLLKLPKKDITDFDVAEKQSAEYKEVVRKFNALCDIASAIESIEYDLAESPDCEKQLTSAELLSLQYAEQRTDVYSLGVYINQIKEYGSIITKLNNQVEEYDKEEKGILSSLTICPYCGQELDDEAINTLLAEGR